MTLRQKYLLPILIFFLLVSCGQKDATLKGRIFIVAKNGTNYELGLVPIIATSPEKINSYFDKIFSSLKRSLESQKKEYEEKNIDFNSLSQRYQRALSTYLIALDILKEEKKELKKYAFIWSFINEIKRKRSSNEPEFKYALEKFLSAEALLVSEGKVLKPLYEDCKTKHIELSQIRSVQLEIISDHMDLVFLGIPAKQITKSDSDGSFTFQVAKGKKVVIAAKGQRHIGNDKENYYWLETLNLASDQDEFNLFLSNDNLISSVEGRSEMLFSCLVKKPPSFDKIDIQTEKKNWKIRR
jgi:hypothetical protein